ncbi:MAG: hypothetical protein EA398_09455 [Deltaproteobacteria bacterium]|nr:MAG: hypothetical protein EA398_09455 [Deltaproteobacteria bacterium]
MEESPGSGVPTGGAGTGEPSGGPTDGPGTGEPSGGPTDGPGTGEPSGVPTGPLDGEAQRVVSEDGLVVVDVPAGALPAGVVITVTDVSEEEILLGLSRPYAIEPSGTVFAIPARLSLTLEQDPSEIWLNVQGPDLRLARLEDERWVHLETTWDPDTLTLQADLEHLSVHGTDYQRQFAPYEVAEHQPWFLWADRWQGHVWSQKVEETGIVGPFTPHLYRATMAFFGEEAPTWPVVDMPEIFENREANVDTGTIVWGPTPGVLGQVNLSMTRRPCPEYVCEEGEAYRITNMEAGESGFGFFELGDDRELRIVVPPAPPRSRYHFHASSADGSTVATEDTVLCVVGNEISPLGSFPSAETFEWSADNYPAGDLMPGSREVMTGVVHHPAEPPVRQDWARWTFAPVHDREAWRTEFRQHLVDAAASTGLRRSYWEQAYRECSEGRWREREHISCRAADRILNRQEEIFQDWEDDCARIQSMVLEGTVRPVAWHMRELHGPAVDGPKAFCVQVHEELYKRIPTMPAGSHAIFRSRLPWELQQFYPIEALRVLF